MMTDTMLKLLDLWDRFSDWATRTHVAHPLMSVLYYLAIILVTNWILPAAHIWVAVVVVWGYFIREKTQMERKLATADGDPSVRRYGFKAMQIWKWPYDPQLDFWPVIPTQIICVFAAGAILKM